MFWQKLYVFYNFFKHDRFTILTRLKNILPPHPHNKNNIKLPETRARSIPPHPVVSLLRGFRSVHDGQGQLRLSERVRDTGRDRDAAAPVAVLHSQLPQHLPNRTPAQGRVVRAALLTGNTLLWLRLCSKLHQRTYWSCGPAKLFVILSTIPTSSIKLPVGVGIYMSQSVLKIFIEKKLSIKKY